MFYAVIRGSIFCIIIITAKITGLETFMDTLFTIYEPVSKTSTDWVRQGRDLSKAKKAEVFFVGKGDKFPVSLP